MQQVKQLTIHGLTLISANQSVVKKSDKKNEYSLPLYDYKFKEADDSLISIEGAVGQYSFDQFYKLVLKADIIGDFKVSGMTIESNSLYKVTLSKRTEDYYTNLTVSLDKDNLPDKHLNDRKFIVSLEKESEGVKGIECVYEEVLLPFQEFLTDPYYLGEFSKEHCMVFPYWLKQIEAIEKCHSPCVAFLGDKDVGKTTVQLLYAIYDFCKLQAMDNPNEQLQLLGDIDFYIVHRNHKTANDLLGFVEGVLYSIPFLQDLQKQNRYKQYIKFKAICTEMLSICRAANIATIVFDDIQDSEYQDTIAAIKMLEQKHMLYPVSSAKTRWGYNRHVLLNGNITDCKQIEYGLDLFSFDVIKSTFERVKPELADYIKRMNYETDNTKELATSKASQIPDSVTPTKGEKQ